VLTTPLSFVASANCARYVGANVGFVDIDPTTWNIDVHAVGRCDALVAVHYAGLPCDLASLPTRPRVVIEDACHALGARTPDGPVGNCAHSDMTVFSFHPVKSITTGEGGAVTTNSAELADALRRARNFGSVPKPEQGGWYYECESLGFNYRMNDMQAALGTSQLGKLGHSIALRGALADRYRRMLHERALPGVGLPPAAMPGWRHAYHLFPVLVPNRREIYDALRADGIGVQVHYVPIYRHPIYAEHGYTHYDFPSTEHVYSGLLSLPIYPALTRAQQDRVVDALAHALAAADQPVTAGVSEEMRVAVQ
jgi:dTDP-4-amino-4,6-dideoxygalactose transaminase